ncbi:MAG TPA: hypothetical protein VMC08_01710, partial [Bacteroidales bacterium]|nr:hypothetical protein [Bacteroidales bacterium]
PQDESKNSPTHQQITLTFNSTLINTFELFCSINGDEFLGLEINYHSLTGLVAQPPEYFTSFYYFNPNYYETIDYDSIYYVGINKFSNVVHTRYTYNGTGKKIDLHFSKNVGIIKIVFQNIDSTNSWSLIRYHAIQ